jgi:uncharacterized protein DUF4406
VRPYVSGPITALPELSRDEKFARFARAELVLRNEGHEPVNPLNIQGCDTLDCNPAAVGQHRTYPDGRYKHTWECMMRYDLIAMLAAADSIALLPGWDQSPGALLSRTVALSLGWPVMDLSKNAVVLGLPHLLGR